MIDGIIARRRVINLLIHGLMRNCKYPSITIWPANVPVMVELCPAAIKATAKRMEEILKKFAELNDEDFAEEMAAIDSEGDSEGEEGNE